MSDSTYSYLDSYCERAGDAGMWAEPINAITNLAFIIAAAIAYRAWASHPHTTLKDSWDMLLLTIILAVIGLGSGAWHLFANSHTLLMDVIPIVLFMNIYLVAAAIRLLKWKWYMALGLFALFQALNIASENVLPREFLNGTIMYIPAFVLLAFLVFKSRATAPDVYPLMRKAIGLWVLSLVFRTVDMESCNMLPFGTHFLWHVLNAWVLGLLLLALIRNFSQSKQ